MVPCLFRWSMCFKVNPSQTPPDNVLVRQTQLQTPKLVTHIAFDLVLCSAAGHEISPSLSASVLRQLL